MSFKNAFQRQDCFSWLTHTLPKHCKNQPATSQRRIALTQRQMVAVCRSSVPAKYLLAVSHQLMSSWGTWTTGNQRGGTEGKGRWGKAYKRGVNVCGDLPCPPVRLLKVKCAAQIEPSKVVRA